MSFLCLLSYRYTSLYSLHLGLALYDERKRPEIVEHLLDVHRRGPDGYVENDNDQWSKRMTQDEIDQYLLFKECNCPNPIKGGRKDLNLSCTCRKDPIYDAKRLKSSMNEHVRSLMRQTGVHGTNSKGYDDLYEEIILHDSFLSPHFRQFWGLFQQRETGQYAKLWFTAFKSWQTDCNNKGCNDMTFSRGADSWNKLPACRKPLGQVEVSRLEMDAPIHSFLFEENRLLRDKVETLEMEAPIRSILLEENALLRDMVAMSNTMASMRTKETKLITDEAERLLRDKVERLEMEAPIHSFLLEKNGLLEYMVEMLKTMASIRSEETKLLKNEVARLEMEASLHSNEMEELKRKLEIIRGVFSGGDSC